jgi:hypothetical protein
MRCKRPRRSDPPYFDVLGIGGLALSCCGLLLGTPPGGLGLHVREGGQHGDWDGPGVTGMAIHGIPPPRCDQLRPSS